MAITTIDAVKSHMGISGSTLDAALETWISQCEAALSRLVKRQISEVTVTEYQSGTGTNRFWLRASPVQSITSLRVDQGGFSGQGSASFGPETQLASGRDYALDLDSGALSMSGKVWRIGGCWDRPLVDAGMLTRVPGDGMGNVRIEYVAGWPEGQIPADIVLACTLMVVQIKNSRSDGMPLLSEGMDYYNYTRVNPADMAKAIGSVESLISSWKRLVV